jgi:4'-phosphopantetheinyl transferase
LSCDPASIEFSCTSKGKPFITESLVHFNISSSGDEALFAFSDSHIGVDIEKIDEQFDYEVMLRGHFSEAEREHIRRLPHSQQHKQFFRGWTRKEACVKAVGVGVGVDLRLIEVPSAPLKVELRSTTLMVYDLPYIPGFAASAAVAD